DEYVALDSPSSGLNDLELVVADRSTVLVVWRKTYFHGAIGGKDDSAYTLDVCPRPWANHFPLYR
ncbi:MAG: hypothetical protein ABR589_09720, partial [Chthoniobacterales bacterium]